MAFLGTPEVAVVTLRAIVEAGVEVPLVVTRADTRRGRGGRTQPSPVKAAALDLGLAVTDRLDDLLTADVDLGVVVAYGKLIGRDVLERVPLVNLHFSRLPRWRGAAPVERAILAGDRETGVDLMVVEEGLDTGPVYARATVEIGDDETADELRARLAERGSELLVAALRGGFPEPVPQSGEATYADKLTPDDRHLDWTRAAVEVHRRVRIGGAWTTFRGRRFKVGRIRPAPPGAPALAPGELGGTLVGTGTTPLELVEVQPEGKARQPADAWVRGAHLQPGERFER